MLCERCKIREANIQYTEVVSGVKKEHHFCAQCAKEMDFGVYAAIFDGEFPIGKLLSACLELKMITKDLISFIRLHVPLVEPPMMHLSGIAGLGVLIATVCLAP